MFQVLLSIIIFLTGLVFGSFLNCVIYRLETKQSFLKGRSYCPLCKHKLSWIDLVPVFSFIFLKGKCRYCQKKISAQYPLVETATGILFVFIINHIFLPGVSFLMLSKSTIVDLLDGGFFSQNLILVLFSLLITCFLIIIFVYDLKHFIIPDKVIYPAIVLTFIYRLFWILSFELDLTFGFWNLDFKKLLNPLFSAAIASAFFLTIFLISRGRWIGFGDVKLGFFMGLLLGWPNIISALFISFLLGAIIGVGLILAKKKGLKSEVPFGPFLVTGTFIALFWGEKIINWYLGLFI